MVWRYVQWNVWGGYTVEPVLYSAYIRTKLYEKRIISDGVNTVTGAPEEYRCVRVDTMSVKKYFNQLLSKGQDIHRYFIKKLK